jgi:hypothetical protein
MKSGENVEAACMSQNKACRGLTAFGVKTKILGPLLSHQWNRPYENNH